MDLKKERNQLNYKQNIFIIKKIIDFPPKTTQMEEFPADFWSPVQRPYFSLLSIFFFWKKG